MAAANAPIFDFTCYPKGTTIDTAQRVFFVYALHDVKTEKIWYTYAIYIRKTVDEKIESEFFKELLMANFDRKLYKTFDLAVMPEGMNAATYLTERHHVTFKPCVAYIDPESTEFGVTSEKIEDPETKEEINIYHRPIPNFDGSRVACVAFTYSPCDGRISFGAAVNHQEEGDPCRSHSELKKALQKTAFGRCGSRPIFLQAEFPAEVSQHFTFALKVIHSHMSICLAEEKYKDMVKGDRETYKKVLMQAGLAAAGKLVVMEEADEAETKDEEISHSIDSEEGPSLLDAPAGLARSASMAAFPPPPPAKAPVRNP